MLQFVIALNVGRVLVRLFGEEERYRAALDLVAQIDCDLREGTRDYYDVDGRRLADLGEVVRAILSNSLATEGGVGNDYVD